MTAKSKTKKFLYALHEAHLWAVIVLIFLLVGSVEIKIDAPNLASYEVDIILRSVDNLPPELITKLEQIRVRSEVIQEAESMRMVQFWPTWMWGLLAVPFIALIVWYMYASYAENREREEK